jgi:hypothetical protein
VAVGDFDHNGIPDLAVANHGDNTVSVLLGNGDGTFRGATDNPLPVGSDPDSVAVGDFNRDGIPDLAVANVFDNTVSVLLGNGDSGGTFQAATSYPAGNTPLAVAVGDFNQDGAPDLAVTSFDDNAVDVFLNQTPVTTTTITASPSPAILGQPITFTAAVTQAVPGPFAPTGSVNFLVDGQVAGSGTLIDGVAQFGGAALSGVAQFSTAALGAGYHTVTAAYQGDPHYSPSSSLALQQLVNQDGTTTALNASANPALAGQPLTLTATVTPAVPGFGPPTGTVLFMDGAATIGSGALNGGIATFTTAALSAAGSSPTGQGAGAHFLSALYMGDKNFTGSSSQSLFETANNPTPVVTGLSPSTVPEGTPTFTLAVNGSGFLPSATVMWNGTPLAVTAASSTQIQVAVPAALLADEGTGTVTVTNPFSAVASLPQTFTIADAGLTASGANISVLGNKKFSGTVATFTDGNPGATASDFTALITWDNGTANFGTLAGTGPGGVGPFTVTGTHTFGAFTNAHTVSVTIFDKGGNTITVTDNVIDPPAPGGQGSAPAGNPASAPAVPPVDELFAALEAAMQTRRRHHHGRPAGGHHPGHHAHPRAHRQAGGEGRA